MAHTRIGECLQPSFEAPGEPVSWRPLRQAMHPATSSPFLIRALSRFQAPIFWGYHPSTSKTIHMTSCSMESTPPPPTRLRTPPTPRHGARYDNYEPYHPRRSARVEAQHRIPPLSPPTSPESRSTLDPSTMLPTPNKTPRKRAQAPAGSAARILHFKAAHADEEHPLSHWRLGCVLEELRWRAL